MKRNKTIFNYFNFLIFLLAAGGFISLIFTSLLFATAQPIFINKNFPTKPYLYTYKIINVYPHDPSAFTQGLVYENNILFEGTGIQGRSFLLKKIPETGKILKSRKLPANYFGEGVALFNDKAIQLTWKDHVAFIYDKNSFKLIKKVNYPTEGWGITYDGKMLIMSDGSSFLYFYDPETFKEIGKIEVRDHSTPVINLNELEYIKGEVWANIWGSDRIAIIELHTGEVKGWLDLNGILDHKKYKGAEVLNGIAYDSANDRVFVTGKLWPFLFEIEIVEVRN